MEISTTENTEKIQSLLCLWFPSRQYNIEGRNVREAATEYTAMKKKRSLLSIALFVLLPACTFAQNSDYQSILNLLSKDKSVRHEATQKLIQSNNQMLIPALVDAFFFIPRANRYEVTDLLKKMSGEDPGDGYYDWVEYVGRRSDLKSPPGYTRFKVTLLSLIDPTYKKIIYTGVPLRIRPEEIVWGGVKLDGIPPIDAPAFRQAAQADLKDGEKIFGIALKGESRAYPLRYLSWHEMLNDSIAGEPITISY